MKQKSFKLNPKNSNRYIFSLPTLDN